MKFNYAFFNLVVIMLKLKILFMTLAISFIVLILQNKPSFLVDDKNEGNIDQIKSLSEFVLNNKCELVYQQPPAPQDFCPYHSSHSTQIGLFSLGKIKKKTLHLARLYIQTVKYAVSNLFYVNYDGIIDGSSWPPGGNAQALTMTGIRRLDNLQMILENDILRGIKGDFIETGVWRGGLCILARAIFTAYEQYDRTIFLADSFDGIPPVNKKEFPVDSAHSGSEKLGILGLANTGGLEYLKKKMSLFFNVFSNRKEIGEGRKVKTVEEQDPNEKEFDVKTVYLKDFFNESLPLAISNKQFKCFAVLRLDGDIYESTWQSLTYLYPYLNVGGIIIVDDFTDWVGAYQAVHDFRKKENINSPILQVYHNPQNQEKIRGIYFLKDSPKYSPYSTC